MRKKRPKKTKKQIARIEKQKSLSKWSKEVRDRDKQCIACGRIDHLNAHHILPKENYKEFVLELLNGVALCPTHHKFGKYSAHRNPIWFSNFLQQFNIKQYEWAISNLGSHEKTNDKSNKT